MKNKLLFIILIATFYVFYGIATTNAATDSIDNGIGFDGKPLIKISANTTNIVNATLTKVIFNVTYQIDSIDSINSVKVPLSGATTKISGIIVGPDKTTDNNGQVDYRIHPNTTGIITVTACKSGYECGSININVIENSSNKQTKTTSLPTPTSVKKFKINISPQSAGLNVSEKVNFNAVLTDQDDEPVENAKIIFSLSNLSIGSLSQESVITDLKGKALVNFIAKSPGITYLTANNSDALPATAILKVSSSTLIPTITHTPIITSNSTPVSTLSSTPSSTPITPNPSPTSIVTSAVTSTPVPNATLNATISPTLTAISTDSNASIPEIIIDSSVNPIFTGQSINLIFTARVNRTDKIVPNATINFTGTYSFEDKLTDDNGQVSYQFTPEEAGNIYITACKFGYNRLICGSTNITIKKYTPNVPSGGSVSSGGGGGGDDCLREAVKTDPLETYAGDNGKFNLNLSASRHKWDITWYINNTKVFNESGIQESSYVNQSGLEGTWVVNAEAKNGCNKVSAAWIWNVIPKSINNNMSLYDNYNGNGNSNNMLNHNYNENNSIQNNDVQNSSVQNNLAMLAVTYNIDKKNNDNIITINLKNTGNYIAKFINLKMDVPSNIDIALVSGGDIGNNGKSLSWYGDIEPTNEHDIVFKISGIVDSEVEIPVNLNYIRSEKILNKVEDKALSTGIDINTVTDCILVGICEQSDIQYNRITIKITKDIISGISKIPGFDIIGLIISLMFAYLIVRRT